MQRVEIRRLSTYTFDEAVALWNEGFHGYAFDLTMSLELYLSRTISEGLSPRYSLVASVNNKPCGFLLNGFRTVADQKVVWNGGTGIIPELRGQGVGRALVEAALELYKEENVAYASLEAISTNVPAIHLYQKFGYETLDRVAVLRRRGNLTGIDLVQSDFTLLTVGAADIGRLTSYRTDSAWQTQWQSVAKRGGVGLLVKDVKDKFQAYALYSKHVDESGSITSITLNQLEVEPSCVDANEVVHVVLQHVFAPLDVDCLRGTLNLRKSNETVVKVLEEWGFAPFFEQLHMRKQIRKS